MKVKKLLKTLYNTEYVIKTDYGTDLERGYSGITYDGQTIYGNRKIKSIEVGNYIMIITLEERKDNENANNNKKIIAKNKEKEDEEHVKHIREKYGITPNLGKISYKEGKWVNDATNI